MMHDDIQHTIVGMLQGIIMWVKWDNQVGRFIWWNGSKFWTFIYWKRKETLSQSIWIEIIFMKFEKTI